MLRENLKDAGQIVQNILTQPLSIPGASKETVSLLDAAKNYNDKDPSTSDLKKIVEMLAQYPEPTKIMLQELEILSNELKT